VKNIQNKLEEDTFVKIVKKPKKRTEDFEEYSKKVKRKFSTNRELKRTNYNEER